MRNLTDSLYAAAPEADAAAPQGNSFTQGMRQSVTAAGGQLHALAGGVGAALGADDFAARQYAASQEAQQLAATQAPAVSDWRQVTDAPDMMTGMRNAGSYVAGLAGGALPLVGAGLAAGGVAALTKGAVSPLLAGTLAVAPFETGGALQRQQADPVMAKASAGDRLGTAALEGLGRSAAMNAVPQLMGSKLLGAGLGAGTKAGIIAEGVGGNALAGAAAEKISTTAEDSLNPNRDTSGDDKRMLDAAVAGGALGVPFAGAGIVGHAIGGKAAAKPAGRAIDEGAGIAAPVKAEGAPVEPAAKPTLFERMKGAFTKGDDTAEKMAAGRDIVDVDALKSAPPEQQGQMLRDADGKAAETAKGWADELMQDGGLSPEKKEALAKAAGDLGDKANRAFVAGLKVAKDASKKAMDVAGELSDAVTSAYNDRRARVAPRDMKGKNGEAMLEDGNTIHGETRWVDEPQKSEISGDAHKVIADVLAPHIEKNLPAMTQTPEGMQRVASSVARVMQGMADTGSVPEEVAGHLQKLFGKDTASVLTQLHEQVLDHNDKPATENYFRAVNKLDNSVSTREKLITMMRGAMPDGEKARPDQLNQMADHLQEYVSGATMDGKTREQRIAHSRMIESALRDHFGDKADDILEAAHTSMYMDREASGAQLHDDRVSGDLPDDSVEYAGNHDDGFADHTEAGVTTARDLDREYFGGGKDKNDPLFMPSEQLHRQDYGNEDSQAAKVMRAASAEHPDKNVSYITAAEYQRQHGLSTGDLIRMGVKGDPKDFVMVQAEGQKRDGLQWKDVDRIKLDTHKYPDSDSRINTSAGPLDAVKVLKMYAQEHMLERNDGDATNSLHRLRRQFTTAIAHLTDLTGENIHVGDDVVVARRGGRALTWGDLKEKGTVKPDADLKYVSDLNNAREAAKATGDVENVNKLDARMDRRMLRENDPDNELLDGNVKSAPSSAELAFAAAKLGEVSKKLKAEVDKRGPLRDANGKPVRTFTMRENFLMNDYRKAMEGYEKAEENLRWQREGGEVHDAGARAARQLGEPGSDVRGVRKAGDGEGDFKSHMNMESGSWSGASEIAPDGQIHLATKEHGEGELGGVFAASRTKEAGPEGNLLHADNFSRPDPYAKELPPAVRSAIDSRVNSLEQGKSAAQRAWGEKGRFLVENMGSMDKMDAAYLASIAKEKDPTVAGKTINALYAKYKDVAPTEKGPVPFIDRVVGKGDVTAAIKAIKASDKPRDIQRAIDALAPHQHDASARAVLEAANRRIDAIIEGDPDKAYSMQRVDPRTTSAADARLPVKAYIEKVLGKTVDVEFMRMLHAGEFLTDTNRIPRGLNADLIRISTHSMDPMGVAYHESLHALFAKLSDAKLLDEAHPLNTAAKSAHVMKQLRDLLANEPDALAQLSDPNERAAYMYQFWAAGKLQLRGRPEGVMGRIADFFKKTLGIWTNDERAEHIMQYFHSGEYAKNIGDRSAVARALTLGENERLARFKDMIAPLGKMANAIAATGDSRLRSTGIDALAKLADTVYAPLHGEHGGDPGYLPAARTKRGEIMNQLADGLAKFDKGVLDSALESLQRGLKGTSLEEREAVRAVRSVLDKTFLYMRDKGVDIEPLGFGKDYFPRVWDANTILRNEPAFRDMMQKYVSNGEFKGSIEQVIATLTRTDGADFQNETIKPGMQSAKKRILDFIKHEDAAPFLNKDLFYTLNSYMTQATRRAEWAERFGDDNAKLHGMLHDARKQGATPEHLALATEYLQGVDGTLGDKINPKMRRAFGNAIVYQNLRLLPLAIFSSLIDPLGISVRGGTTGEAFGAMTRGFKEMRKSFQGDPTHDTATQLAATLGVIDSAVLQHNLGTSYSQGMTSNMGRKLNDMFFKYNLMEQYNTSMRVAASQAAIGFLGRHADGTASPHSARWLAELGFKPKDIVMKDGQPLLQAHEFESAGYAPDEAAKMADRMTLAVNKWVDGAILRPNAAHKPVWMNDPHFALVAHLKQFVYSFQETILKRVGNEVKHGNMGPAYALAAYVPFMLAADSAKGFLVGGGEQPDWKKGWGVGDYLFYELQRAGLFGVGQFAIDAGKDLHRGGLGVGALVGPSLEQLGDAAKTIGGAQQYQTFISNAMPANALFDAAGNASASTNAVD